MIRYVLWLIFALKVSSIFAGDCENYNLDFGDTDQPLQEKPKRARLPKAAVALLRAWLINHLDDPYPSEEEKHELSGESGLSFSQVNSWFTNARRRILPGLKEKAVAKASLHWQGPKRITPRKPSPRQTEVKEEVIKKRKRPEAMPKKEEKSPDCANATQQQVEYFEKPKVNDKIIFQDLDSASNFDLMTWAANGPDAEEFFENNPRSGTPFKRRRVGNLSPEVNYNSYPHDLPYSPSTDLGWPVYNFDVAEFYSDNWAFDE